MSIVGSSSETPTHLVFYDGNCGFCDHTVQWLLARDAKEVLYFAPLQGAVAASVLPQFGLPEDLDSIVYVHTTRHGEAVESSVYIYSDAIGQILKTLPLPWSWLRVAWVVPKFLRDAVYKGFAARRIQWFGTVDACQLPDERQSRRLLS